MLSTSPVNNNLMNLFEQNEMCVVKRNGDKEPVSFDKILKRLNTLCKEANIKVNTANLVIRVVDQLHDNILTTHIDELCASLCASMTTIHPDYNVLAGRIINSNHHKNTSKSFVEVMTKLYDFKDINDKHTPLISEELYTITKKYATKLDRLCDYSKDNLIDYFGFKTLERAYLMKINKKVVERIQHMWLRVSIGIHGENYDKIAETYKLMSSKYFTHATPTLYNSGTPRPQLSSCFLLQMESDSIDGIFNTLKECAQISKLAGGIGLHIHNIRATDSHIRGTNGTSNGIVPMLRVFNSTAKYVDQCVHPETIIYTTQGPTQIQNCSIGETYIYNIKGEIEVIQNVLEHNYSGDFLEIKTLHSLFPLKITPEHPVYALCGQVKGLNHTVIRNRLDKKLANFKWVDAGELDVNDMIAYPIPTYSNDIANITADDCYMYGVILGDGCMNYKTNSSGNVALHTVNKKHILDFIINYFNKKCIETFITVDGNTTKIRWNMATQLLFRYNDFYDENKQKRVNHKWLNLPLDKSKYILKGLIDTDGCISEKEMCFDSTSLNLIEVCRFICLRMGILTSGYIRDRIGEIHTTEKGRIIENKLISYVLRIPRTKELCDLMNIDYNEKQFFKFFKYNNFILSRIQSINKTTYTGILYDLQLKDQHNYLLHNGLVHNGGGRRSGSFAIYLEPWHADIELFLDMRKNHGDEELKARDLFYALWVPDLFMERVKSNGKWTLMCPDECPGLADVYGDDFVNLYTKYESENRGKKTVNARDLWYKVLDAQMETGTPYLSYKDAVNKKSNQKNIGVIKSSNLCNEITLVSNENETAVCNLASVSLPAFVDKTDPENPVFNYDKLHEITKVITYNLNRVIDVNYYPNEKTRLSNLRHRPIGVGVQGLADVFFMMNLPFTCDKAKEINRNIFETMYHAALEKSMEMAITDGKYETFDGSPTSSGVLQFDMWGVKQTTDRYDWDDLKQKIVINGLRNSMLLALMPTASSSQILGNNEAFEPITSNIYSRRTNSGEFVIVNKYLVNDLIKLKLWNEKIKDNIIANNGSIQHIDLIPEDIREKYRTVWEMKMKDIIDMSADRGIYIDQTQSLNLFIQEPTYNNLTSMHFYAWSKGLKTGLYYLRRRSIVQAQKFTIDPELTNAVVEEDEEHFVCDSCGA